MRENRPSSLMSGVWKRSPVDETEPPRHTSTLLSFSLKTYAFARRTASPFRAPLSTAAHADAFAPLTSATERLPWSRWITAGDINEEVIPTNPEHS